MMPRKLKLKLMISVHGTNLMWYACFKDECLYMTTDYKNGSFVLFKKYYNENIWLVIFQMFASEIIFFVIIKLTHSI